MTKIRPFTFFHNPNCSKSRACLSQVATSKKPFTIRNFIESPLTEQELIELLILHHNPIALLREAKGDEDHGTIIQELLSDPARLQRPLLTTKTELIILRPDHLLTPYL